MKKFAYFALSMLVILSAASWVSAESVPQNEPNWTNPAAKTLKKVSSTTGSQRSFNLLNNMDCQLITYRLVSSAEMRTGCFAPTAFGYMDISGGIVIFNGTDEGIPVTPKANGTVLVPWPNAGTLIALTSVTTGGSYLSLYSSPLSVMENQRTGFLLTSKKMSEPPDIQLKDASGQRLIINAQTLAISDGGSWLVAETYSGSFVRINLATLDTKQFAPAYQTGGLASRVAVSEDGRHVAILNKNYNHLKVYDLSNCTSNTCVSHNYYSLLSDQLGSITTAQHLRFVNRDLLSVEIGISSSEKSGTYQLAPKESIDSMTDYIGMGDSYTSGEGAFNYRDGTDTKDNRCHLSIHSYPMLLTKDLFTNMGGHSVACSGAKINDIGNSSSSYRGQMRNSLSLSELLNANSALLESVETNYLPGYVAQHRFIKRWQPKIATVSIGGNDIGFGSILQQCVMPKVSRHHSDSVCFNTYEDRVEVKNLIDRTIPRWTALFKQLKITSPLTQYYAIGYPDVIDDTGNCAINVNLNKSELEFAKELVVYLNQGIEKAANSANITYVDITHALLGHRLCETKSHNVAVNGLTAGKDTFAFGHESYHPNALGHQLIEQEILRKTNNLTSGDFEPTQPNSKLLDAPKSGRSITTKTYAEFTSTVHPSGSNSMDIRLYGNLLKPNSNYSALIAGQNIGSLNTDGEGNIQSSINVPSLPSGPHNIDIIGDGQNDEPISITQPIYVPDSANDFDGDGIVDDLDSCLTIVNSGQDADLDGIDDICDPLIEESHVAPDTQPPQGPLDPDPSPKEIEVTLPTPKGVSLEQNSQQPIVTLSLNSGRGLGISKSAEIYHGLGVRVNNDSPVGNSVNSVTSVGKRLQHIRHRNPWVIWWVYIIFAPLLLWLVISRALWAKQRFS